MVDVQDRPDTARIEATDHQDGTADTWIAGSDAQIESWFTETEKVSTNGDGVDN